MLRGGKQGDVDHEVSILTQLGGGDGAGRSPSKVSTMIIRPPQHGHRCAGEGVSASLSAWADGRSRHREQLADALDVVALEARRR